VSFKAPAAFEPSSSSVAVFVAHSASVTFTHATLSAHRGADGESPEPPVTDSSPGASMYGARGLNGESALLMALCSRWMTSIPAECCQQHAGGGSGTWQNNVGWGGPGGAGGFGGYCTQGCGLAVNGSNGGSAGLASGGTGGTSKAPDGLPGAPGEPGTAGKPGTHLGVVTEDGYLATNKGTSGTYGTGGAGGGGGRGSEDGFCMDGDIHNGYWIMGTGGGQGGHGGRGGKGAPGSPAGGASIGLLTLNSEVSLVSSTITTASGGRGGDAVAGADGQAGGAGGQGGYSYQACRGSLSWRSLGGNRSSPSFPGNIKQRRRRNAEGWVWFFQTERVCRRAGRRAFG
jgi:hypothetical protein